ncbi:MAG TPA: ATP-grasp fold amidoligase family protein [Sphingomicrobium sp.]|jgi:hypothetical protein|nr:ATP-grasp fold amidoligase family protein [Sphingomicrobium sp.]
MLKRAVGGLLPGRFRQKLLYKRIHGRWPNLRSPQTFTEKVFWRKFNDRNPLYTFCTDKLKVRGYVGERVGSDVLVPLIFETANPEDLRELASWRNVVVKANHGWKMMEIIGDEEPSEQEKARIIGECHRWLAISHARLHGEMHYDGIEPRVMVERFVGDRQRTPLDCKVHCFWQDDGTVMMMVQLVADRHSSKSMSYYIDGLDERHVVRDVGDNPPRIEGLHQEFVDAAIRKSKILSADFDYVRVDWMLTADSLFFSELTFTPGAGLSRSMGPQLDQALGRLWVQQSATNST